MFKSLKSLTSITMIAVTVTLFCCKKESVEEIVQTQSEPISIEDGRFAFSSNESFSKLIKESITQKDPLRAYRISKDGVKNANQLFVPLLGDPTVSNGRLVTQNDTLIDDLVPDEYLARLLNKDRELKIGENILKITPEGTFMCHISKYNRLKEILESNVKYGDKDKAGKYMDIEPGIFFYDSFASQEPSERIEFSAVEPKHTQAESGRVTMDYLTKATYDSFETHTFGSHTIVGGWIEKALGRREVQYISIGNRERLKLNFYNVNYIVFSSVGITAKAQHRTWIGWGGDLKVSQMRMGWDGIALVTPLRGQPSPNIPSVSFEKLTLGDIGVDVASYNVVDSWNNGWLYNSQVKQISDAIDGKIQETFATTLKKTYDIVYQNLAPQQVAWQKQYTDQFRMLYPDKMRQIVGRYEEVEEDVHVMSKSFDWSTGIFSFSSNGTTFGPSNFGLGQGAITYKIEKASIYACVYHGGTWRGIRIIKQ